MKKFALLCILFLPGCMTTSHFTGPTGQVGHITSCNGTMRSMADCYNEANKVCDNKGYVILKGSDEQCYLGSGFGVCRELTYTCR